MIRQNIIANMIARAWGKSVLPIGDLKHYKNGIFICILGFAATFFAFYPGFMSWDSMNQYEQALSGEYNDWQPPVMATFWSVLNIISPGPHVMLTFHLTLYWAGFVILYVAYRTQGSRLAMYFPLVAFCPCLLNTVGVIWKDVGLAVAWTFCIALLVYFSSSRRRIGLVSGTMIYTSFLYGYLVRNNSFVSAPFILFLIVYVHITTNKVKRLKKWTVIAGVSTVALVCTVVLANTFTKAISTRTFQAQYVMLDDLAAMYRATDTEYFPDHIRNTEEYDKFLGDVRSIEIGALFYPSNSYYATRDQSEYLALRSQWVKAIRENLGVYIKYRCGVFFDLFLAADYNTAKCEYFSIIPNQHGIVFEPNWLFIGYIFAAQSIRHVLPFLFKPVFWFCLNIVVVLAIMVWKRFREDVLICCLWLVSFSYFIGYLVYLTVLDFRFIYLSVMVSLVLLGMMANKASLDLGFAAFRNEKSGTCA